MRCSGLLGLDLSIRKILFYGPATNCLRVVTFLYTVYGGDELRLRFPGQLAAAKQTYTDTAMGVVRQSDWITGYELRCFGVRRRVVGCTTICVFAQFRSVSNSLDKPKH